MDFCPKFAQNDIIGCGIAFVSQKIFFTRNGTLLGRAFDLTENFPMFASATLSSPQDSVLFNFVGPFEFKLDEVFAGEKKVLSNQIQEEKVDCRNVFKLVKDYLEYQGFPDTLRALEEHMSIEKHKKGETKLRSYSGLISERYRSVDFDSSCHNCEAQGKICNICVKKIMENVEAGTNVRLPESRNRCDSVDLASLYLKSSDFLENPIPNSPGYAKDLKQRGTLRQIILTGNIKEAIGYLTEYFPEMLNDELCMLYLAMQEFIEIIKAKEIYKALDFGREKLARFKNYTVYYRKNVDVPISVLQAFGIIAYENPHESPLAPFLTWAQLELTADLVNCRIMMKSQGPRSCLEGVLKHLLCTQHLYQENLLMSTPSNISLMI